MGSFKTAAARKADQATLTAADRPMAEYEEKDGKTRLVRAEVPEDQWLQDGESITYWTRLPHGYASDIADAATTAEVVQGNRRARRRAAAQLKATYHPGRSALATFVLGIVDWTLTDENDQPVPFERPSFDDPNWVDKARAIMSGLPAPVVDELQSRIGASAPPSLDELAEDAEDETDTVGNV